MRNIYSGIDIGSDSVKIVVLEKIDSRYHVLATIQEKSEGLKRGIIVDYDKLLDSVKNAVEKLNSKMGFKLTKTLLNISSVETKVNVKEAKVKIYGDTVSSRDITSVLDEVTKGAVDPKDELVCVTPIMFSVDKKENIKKPQGKEGKFLGVNAVIVSSPKKYLYPYFNIFNELDIEIVDLTLSIISDYAAAKTNQTDTKFGAVINFGEDMIDFAVFNKGIMIKSDQLKFGSRNVDRDISYVYGLDLLTSRNLKERFAYAYAKDADINDSLDLPSVDGGTITINQKEVSDVTEARLKEMLNLTKKAINNLTNRKISYIIITGGLSELSGFDKLVEEVLGIEAKILSINEIGIRTNNFSSAYGIIKYYNEKLELRSRNYSMLNDEEIILMMNNNDESMLKKSEEKYSKVSNYFIQ